MREIILDIGCGDSKHKDAIGLDRRLLAGVNIVCNFEKGLPIRSDSVDKIFSSHTLEHLDDIELFLKEVKRVLKDSGAIAITVPHFSNSLGYSDYTHKRFFGFYTFDYFSSVKNKYWGVPTYVSSEYLLHIESKRLIFRNITFFGKYIESIVNYSDLTAYIYESKLSWFFPCAEIAVLLKKI
jgi:ubiquinone/menaquinone biosynthesis C-methylase UbiE